jgi:hypothetical protein
MGEGGGEGKHWMLCGAVVVSRGGCCHMKGLCKARGERKGEEQERERERETGEMSEMSGLPSDASFLEFKACWRGFFFVLVDLFF